MRSIDTPFRFVRWFDDSKKLKTLVHLQSSRFFWRQSGTYQWHTLLPATATVTGVNWKVYSKRYRNINDFISRSTMPKRFIPDTEDPKFRLNVFEDNETVRFNNVNGYGSS